ncbi:MAG: hypothetical protein LBI64_06300 [Coriobacteriales bacterium]|jgi:hypothetical protein|nr:hypothetical protein [Coriobacteriales bacterium]
MVSEHDIFHSDAFDGASYQGPFREVSSILDAADHAFTDGKGRLALHLYCAAFEMEQTGDTTLSGRVVDGLRRAWELACDLGDRPTAEELFDALAPYNTNEQTEQGIVRLQGLATRQLEDLGVTTDDLEVMADAISQEVNRHGGNPLFDSIRHALEHLGVDAASGEETPEDAMPAVTALAVPAPLLRSGGSRSQDAQRTHEFRLDYAALAGYHDAIRYMRQFGLVPAHFAKLREFVEHTSRRHGVFGLSLSEPFFFYGPSRDDVSFFAHATAGEIGWPILHIDVEAQPDGSGTIKLAGPFKRGFLGGPPDIMELETPCIVLVENIDHLQRMFGSEEHAVGLIESHGRPMHGRSLKGEMTGYLRALLRKPGVFLIATAATSDILAEPLRSLIGIVQKIVIEMPHTDERYEVWQRFATDHSSFAHLDLMRLAQLSEGASRHDIVMAGHNAVEKAYRESLRTGDFREVEMEEVLIQLAGFVDHEAQSYRLLEDAAVEELHRALEHDLL